jgi:hypothetical protein
VLAVVFPQQIKRNVIATDPHFQGDCGNLQWCISACLTPDAGL